MTICEFTRRSKKWSQRDLSERTRIGTQFLSLLENRRWIPNSDQLERIGKALGIPADDVMKTTSGIPDEASDVVAQ